MIRSARFEVSLAFLLQQAAWLYERHFAQMKAQMKKLSPSACASPMPPDSTGNVAMNSNVTAYPVGSQGKPTHKRQCHSNKADENCRSKSTLISVSTYTRQPHSNHGIGKLCSIPPTSCHSTQPLHHCSTTKARRRTLPYTLNQNTNSKPHHATC